MIYGVQVRRVCWPIKHRNTMVIEPAFWNLFRQVPSPARKWNQHLHKACQQKEAWSALKFPGRWLRCLWTSENTDDMAAQIITDCGLHTVFCSSPLFLQTLGPWFPNEMLNLLSSAEEDFGPLSNSPVLFLLSPGKMLLMMFLFQKWFGSPFTEDVWAWWLLMHWLSSLLVKLSQVFESALLDSILKLHFSK